MELAVTVVPLTVNVPLTTTLPLVINVWVLSIFAAISNAPLLLAVENVIAPGTVPADTVPSTIMFILDDAAVLVELESLARVAMQRHQCPQLHGAATILGHELAAQPLSLHARHVRC